MALVSSVVIQKASVEDAEPTLVLQKLAYISEAEIINDFSILPLHQTLEEIVTEFDSQLFLMARIENNIIGSVRVYLEGRTCHIGRLIVHPNYQNRGIGTKLLKAAEDQFSDAERYELFTGKKSEKNLHLYVKHGYHIFRKSTVSDQLTMVFLKKSCNNLV